MTTPLVRALAELHATYRGFPVRTRAHVLGRFLTCPFLAVAGELPAGVRVLEIGAGHGIFARLAAAGGARHVIAVEPDLRKSLSSFRHPAISFVAGFDDAVAGRFDVVAMIDVLYKVPLHEWDALFARVAERLVPGGMFLLKEIDPERRVKASWNRAQESVASALNLTLGRSFSYESPTLVRRRLERAGFVGLEARQLGRWYPHAHVLYSARRPAP
jgi:cyclopropane fatty-acyl-phospholipid synthase-like methyltransferase